jgi:murein DD-endopeptidase MepM/ murein hydrolase activator NlpD
MPSLACTLSGLAGSAMLSFAWLWLLRGCLPEADQAPVAPLPPFDAAFVRLSPAEVATLPLATRFVAPMGGENGALTYNARPFRTARHLGDDLNGIGGWNSDFGDPAYAAGDGRVIYTGIPSEGWGKMVMLAHRVPDSSAAQRWRVYVTIYAHLNDVAVRTGEMARCGARIGSVGTAEGKYLAHLHFEVRESCSVYPGLGYADAPLDRVPPEQFLKGQGGHR